ncbi:MAG: SDR family oxidoreductase [Paracoccaceae bacterium]
MKEQPFTNEVALITGGGRGLGFAVSKALAAKGATVCITGQNEEHLKNAVDEIRSGGEQAEYAVGDVTDRSAMEAAVARFHKSAGPITVLINNAGIGQGGPFSETDPDAWWRVMEVNVKGPMLMSRLVLPGMLGADRGHIINIGSYQAIDPAPMVSAYGTSKTALLRLTDSLAAEVIDRGVVVIAVSPGWVWTDMTREAEAGLQKMNPDWDGIDPEYIFKASAVCDLICQIVGGKARPFYGRLLHVKDDLNELLAKSGEVLQTDRFALKFNM